MSNTTTKRKTAKPTTNVGVQPSKVNAPVKVEVVQPVLNVTTVTEWGSIDAANQKDINRKTEVKRDHMRSILELGKEHSDIDSLLITYSGSFRDGFTSEQQQKDALRSLRKDYKDICVKQFKHDTYPTIKQGVKGALTVEWKIESEEDKAWKALTTLHNSQKKTFDVNILNQYLEGLFEYAEIIAAQNVEQAEAFVKAQQEMQATIAARAETLKHSIEVPAKDEETKDGTNG